MSRDKNGGHFKRRAAIGRRNTPHHSYTSKAKGKVTVGSVEDKNGGLVNSTEEVCEEFNDFFLLQCFQEKELRTFRLLGICLAVVKRIC